jgi:integrase
MASLFQMPGRPFWFVQITLPNGSRLPRRSTGKTSKRDAERRAAEIEAQAIRDFKNNDVGQGRMFARIVENAARLAEEGRLSISKAEGFIREIRALANPDHQEVSFRAFYTAWISSELKGLSASHIDNHKGSHKKWCTALGKLADAALTTITVSDLDAAFETVCEGVTAGTANLHLSSIREVFRDAKRRKLIEHNPAADVKRLSAKRADKKTAVRGPFTVDEVRKILSVATDEWRGMILFGFHTSLRMMDIARLGTKNIDGDILVARSNKTDTGTRTPLHPQIAKWLEGRSGKFFPNIADKKVSNVSQTFSNLMSKAGIEKIVVLPGGDEKTRSFHSLRHTFTSVLADAGVNEETRMALTGQKDSAVHAAYTHHGDEKLKKAIDLLPTL